MTTGVFSIDAEKVVEVGDDGVLEVLRFLEID